MNKIFSLHIYPLKKGIRADDFHRIVLEYLEREFAGFPGLLEWTLLNGIKGEHEGKYGILWVYSSRTSWERIWGPVDHPKTREDYPSQWKSWETFLSTLLDREPDKILFTTFEQVDNRILS